MCGLHLEKRNKNEAKNNIKNLQTATRARTNPPQINASQGGNFAALGERSCRVPLRTAQHNRIVSFILHFML